MAVIGIDDTDSRERGMCTTYLAARIADRIAASGGSVERRLLVRLNPAVEYKTRGNAALAVHADCDPKTAARIAREELADAAETADPNTNPGLVVADHAPTDAPSAVADFARAAVRDHLHVETATGLVDSLGYRHAEWKNGRGIVGALAAVGAWRAFDEWTYEYISYREPRRRGTPREIDHDGVFAAADAGYPSAWDTVDRGESESVCVPNTPGPILHGIRGDDADTVREVARAIESEPIERRALFVTNQGTDAHLRDAALDAVADGRAYRTTGTVATDPETREGGHVFVALAEGEATLPCVAFEPTKRFRAHVRALRPGDRVTACGEIADGTLKLEKFAVRDLVETERRTPDCPDCGRSMKSAGAGQGYRCRDCKTTADDKVSVPIERDLERGWYEVPPCARRHIAKPLVRGGFDAPVHPER